MEALHEIVGMDVPMRDCSRAYLNMMSQMSVLLPEIHKTFLNAMAKEERLWIEVIGRGVESGELQNDVQPTILAKIMMSLFYGRAFQDSLIDGMDPKLLMSLFYGRAFQDSLIDGMDPKLLKEEMLAVYERVKKR